MPQFDTAFWLSQIFWLLISFGGLYLGVRFIIFPMFDKIFAARAQRIDIPVEKSEKLLQEVQALQQKLEQKKESFAARQNQRLADAQLQERNRLEQAVAKTEKELSHHLKHHIQKLEREEKQVLADASAFVKQTLKGIE
ncbi:MAG: hypothetical protein ACI4OR_01255 [Alphaproteobacteria bacterium]